MKTAQFLFSFKTWKYVFYSFNLAKDFSLFLIPLICNEPENCALIHTESYCIHVKTGQN